MLLPIIILNSKVKIDELHEIKKLLIRLLRRPIMVKEPLKSSRTIIGWQVIVINVTNYFLLFIIL